jgi:hypothetical protein
MKLKTRLRTRTLMAIVALVALGISLAFEWKNHAERDRLLSRRADGFRQAAIHHKRALECKFGEERQQPYQPAERAKLLASDRVRSSTPPGGFRSWQAELLDHEHWGARMYDQAEDLDRTVQAVEARLLLPVATSR